MDLIWILHKDTSCKEYHSQNYNYFYDTCNEMTGNNFHFQAGHGKDSNLDTVLYYSFQGK